jgi:gliding motility-associated-like protein
MNKIYHLALFIIFFQVNVFAQQFPGFINPGLEGPLDEFIVPPNWSTCNGTPDTYPFNGNGIPPSEGSSYVAVIAFTTDQETFGQQLCEPLKKGVNYTFMADLSRAEFDPDPDGFFEVYGGNSSCSETELLVTTPIIKSNKWIATTLTFTPKADYSYIIFHPRGVNPADVPFLYIDNIRPLGGTTAVTVSRDTSMCLGDSIKLTATGGSGYTWVPGGKTTASIIVSPAITTTYSVTITANCTTVTKTVTVTQKNCVLQAKAKGGALCKDSCLQLNAVGSGGKGPYTYSWQPGNLTGESPTVCPKATTIYTVTLTDQDGKTATDTTTVTVQLPPVLTAVGGAGCPGDSIQLSATGANTYSWNPATDLINPTTAKPLAHPSITTTYTVTGISAGCKATAIATVIINNTLATTISNDTALCTGTSLQLKASGGKTYVWTPATGLSDPTIATPIATPAVTTTYQVVISSGSCSATRKVIITVNPIPVVTASSATICQKEKAVLTASGANTYTWITNAATLTGTGITVMPDKTTTYTVIGTSNGCRDTTETTVIVNTLPVININSPIACSGAKTTLKATGALTYTWLGANGNILSTDSSLTASPMQTITYTVIGTDTKGCKNTKLATLMVHPIPDVIASGGIVCLGNEFKLEAHGNAITYVWTASDSSKLPDKALVIVVPTTNTTYTVTGSTTYCKDTAIAKIVVDMPPIVTVNNETICEGEAILLTASGANTYLWSTGAKTNAISVAPKITSNYIVTGIKDNCFQKVSATVTVNKKPNVLFTASPKELSEYEPTVTLTNESDGGKLSYTWEFDDGASSTLKNAKYTYTEAKQYRICLTAVDSATNCADTLCKSIVYKPQISLYVPNAFTPDADDLNEVFKAKGMNMLDFTMLIFDRWGNKIFESNDMEKGWDGTVNGKGPAPEGIYVWKINCRDVLKKQHQYIGQVTLVK